MYGIILSTIQLREITLSLREITKAHFVGCSFPDTKVGSSKEVSQFIPSAKVHHTATADLVSWGSDDPYQTVGRKKGENFSGQENSFGVHDVTSVTSQTACM